MRRGKHDSVLNASMIKRQILIIETCCFFRIKGLSYHVYEYVLHLGLLEIGSYYFISITQNVVKCKVLIKHFITIYIFLK